MSILRIDSSANTTSISYYSEHTTYNTTTSSV